MFARINLLVIFVGAVSLVLSCPVQAQERNGQPPGVIQVVGPDKVPIKQAQITLHPTGPSQPIRLSTRPDGSAQLDSLPAGDRVRIKVQPGDRYQGYELESYPIQALRGTTRVSVPPRYLEVRAQIQVKTPQGLHGVSHARLFSIGPEGDTLFVASSEKGGTIQASHIPATRFENLSQSRFVVVLPNQVVQMGAIQGGRKKVVSSQLRDGIFELGTTAFSQSALRDGPVRIGGTVLVSDALDRTDTRPINGLVIQAVRARTGKVVDTSHVHNGSWQMQLPPGRYQFTGANFRELGFEARETTSWYIYTDRNDLRQTLRRDAPSIVTAKRQEVILEQPGDRSGPVEDVLLWTDQTRRKQIVESVSQSESRVIVELAEPLPPGIAVQAALQIEGLVTSISSSEVVTRDD